MWIFYQNNHFNFNDSALIFKNILTDLFENVESVN